MIILNNILFSTKLGQETRPMAKLNYKRIEGLPTERKEGWGRGGGVGEKIFLRKDVIAVMVKAGGGKRGSALLYEHSFRAMKMIGS